MNSLDRSAEHIMQYDLTDTISGNEALTVGEKIKLFFSEVSHSIDSFNANNLNSTIHKVKDNNILDILIKKNNYFNISSNQIPVPVFFNPKESSFKEYVDFVLSGIGLVKLTYTEAESVYDGLKTAAAKGQVPYKLRNWDTQSILEELQNNLLKCNKSGDGYLPINAVYNNFTVAKDVLTKFNKTVETLKSRDGEILAKKVNQVIEIMKILKRKIDSSDITIDTDDLLTIEVAVNRLNQAVQMSGRMLSLLNELSRSLELQYKELERYKD